MRSNPLGPRLPLHPPCPPAACLQLLAAVDLNDPVVQATMLAMLPLPEDATAADKENSGGQAAQQEAAAAAAAVEGAIWPVGQVRWGWLHAF